ncbi:Haloacid dehalogenase-like hydrolase-domain-containing protein [Parachaetomium inaequale]|uniref:Haloacid dehalogenase-like hydrolase-domain-containing protein n=1 Tax=Parachaetomium inaequale TaxID=2588326 RepID=A0AAN6PCF3_9PEZI|nr:Haloacid dehalogenase-like hydrolase-domain-containing protein [Parachaetomium inaequale]
MEVKVEGVHRTVGKPPSPHQLIPPPPPPPPTTPPPPPPDLTTFRALSFDCYGTLLDWESGLASDLHPLITLLPATHPFRANPALAVARFNDHSEHLWHTQPKLAYNANLTESFRLLAHEEGVTTLSDETLHRIGDGPGRWPAFGDTVDGLRRLGKFYKLVILSNVNEANIARAVAGPLAGARFDAVYTAEAIGSYKPSLENFRYLFEGVRREFGVDKEKGELLHVARSLTADHVPAKEVGLRSVWIARGGDTPEGYGTGGDYEQLRGEGRLGFEWLFQTVGEFADEVERQFAEKQKE